MLAPVASIHVLNTARDPRSADVDGWDKPDHDGKAQRPAYPAGQAAPLSTQACISSPNCAFVPGAG